MADWQSQQVMDVDGQCVSTASEINHAVLVKDVKSICAKWEEFGVQLGIPFGDLQKIGRNVSGRGALVDFCFNRVIDAWLTGKKENVSKEFLVEAIRGVGGHGVLVEKVEKMKFKKKPKAGPIVSALSEIKHEYSQLGVFLGLDLAKIKEFEKNAGDVDNCMNQVLYQWLNMADEEDDDDDDDEETSNRETFFEALVSVGNAGLAQTLKEKYKGLDFQGDGEAPSKGFL